MSIRNLVIAGTIGIAAALSTGTANAAPASNLSLPIAAESAVQQAYHPGGYYHGYYGHRRLCRLPFHVLARHYGHWQARMIKRRCFRTYW